MTRGAEEGPGSLEGLDEGRLESAMGTLVAEMGEIDDYDSRRTGSYLRRFAELSGLEMGPRLEDALGRLEAGEDVESIESEMESLADDQPLEDFFRLKAAAQRCRRRPKIDDELYFL